MTFVYWIDLKEITPALISRYEATLSESDKQRYRQMTNMPRRLQFLVGRALIWHKCHEVPALLQSGKPVIKNGSISLSHSGDMVALAISAAPVGLDIEKICPRNDYDKVAARLGLHLSDDKMGSFYREFTRYEATYKLGDVRSPYIYFEECQGYQLCVASPLKESPIKIEKENPDYL